MAEQTNISWCDATFNPWLGCTKISDGCKFCYAETLMDKRYGKVKWGPQGTRIRTSETYWKKPLAWNKKAQLEGRRFRVFCASLADVFEDRPELIAWRADLFEMIDQTTNLDWLLLTKRPENILRMVPAYWSEVQWPDHIWVGTSVENQDAAYRRIPELLKVPAKVRFLSMEPLLGPVDLSLWLGDLPEDEDGAPYPGNGLAWIIVGGESGHGARPMHPDWARTVRDQCLADGVAFHFKQWGEWLPPYATLAAGVGYDSEWITEVKRHDRTDVCFAGDDDPAPVWKVGKHAAGRLLDGREWNEMPEGMI